MNKFEVKGLILLLIALISQASCSSRSVPAPVTLLNSQSELDSDIVQKKTYTVEKGDTLFAIAWFSGNDYRDIAKYNNLKPPYVIYPGQTLSLTAPKVVKSSSSLVKSITPKAPSGHTRTSIKKKVLDPKSEQAYGEREQNVNDQKVKADARGVVPKSKPTFPDKVTNWVWPAKGDLVGTFSRSESGNKGIDIRAPRGTPVYAAAAGKVVYSGSALRGYGNLVIIKHSDTFLSAYAHNDAITVKEQQWVAAGQQIAAMGNSGTDSVRLHFEVRYRGKSLDPLRYLPKKP